MAHEEVTKKLSSLQGVQFHAVVNNAGICPYGELEWGSFEMIKRVLEVNTFGQVLVTRTFLPLIRESQGRIINVNSVAARFSVPAMVPYCMSKYASLAFTEGLRREVAKFGVKVISIEPYFFDTKMTQEEAIGKEVEKIWKASSKEVRDAYGEHYMKRLTKQSKLIRPFVIKTLDPVIKAFKHAITATRPQYHYVCADFSTRMMIYTGWYLWPQETIESLCQWFLVTTKRSEPLSNSSNGCVKKNA
jgi:NAD(P)-dependent dehydrogenase (short-subunit alcohol dehydrogenase family)